LVRGRGLSVSVGSSKRSVYVDRVAVDLGTGGGQGDVPQAPYCCECHDNHDGARVGRC